MFRIRGINGEIDNKTATLGLTYIESWREANVVWPIKKKQSLEFGPCTPDRQVPQAVTVKFDQLNFADFNCAYNKNLTLGGNYYAQFFNYIKLEALRCTGGPAKGCNNDTEIDRLLTNAVFEVFFFNSYIDFLDWE